MVIRGTAILSFARVALALAAASAAAIACSAFTSGDDPPERTSPSSSRASASSSVSGPATVGTGSNEPTPDPGNDASAAVDSAAPDAGLDASALSYDCFEASAADKTVRFELLPALPKAGTPFDVHVHGSVNRTNVGLVFCSHDGTRVERLGAAAGADEVGDGGSNFTWRFEGNTLGAGFFRVGFFADQFATSNVLYATTEFTVTP